MKCIQPQWLESFMVSAILECDSVDVDTHQQRFGHPNIIAFVGVDPSLGEKHESIDRPVVICVVESRGTAQNVDCVVLTSQQPLRTEARDLLPGVTLDVIGERHCEASPPFSLHLDRADLLGDEARLRI